MSGKIVTIFGGGGFVGRPLAQALFERGWRVRIAQRHPERGYQVKALGRLGQTQFCAADVTRPESVARAVAGADAVVNLVGILKGDFQAVHVAGARNVAQAAGAAGASALVHMSAMGADAASASAYGRTKAEGEDAVRAAFPQATIVRPSILFGRDDSFTNRFAGMIAAACNLPIPHIVPVIRGETRFQPAFVGDVANAMADAATDPARFGGQTFDLGGPDVMSMAEINRWLADAIGRSPTFVDVPDAIASLIATLTGWMPGAPITADQLAMLHSDNVVQPGRPGFEAFGIRPRPMAAVAPGWLVSYRKHGRFGARASA